MMLKELIEFLAKQDQELVLPYGFRMPHSYRGYYTDLAFEPWYNVPIKTMLKEAQSAIGCTYEGYKGGEYTMSEYTDCWLANYGDTGEGIGPVLLTLMVERATGVMIEL